MSFKLQIVQVERGQLTVTEATKTMVFKIEQLLLMVKKLVTLIGKNQTPLVCQSHQNKDNGA
jgi:hypothetical protein